MNAKIIQIIALVACGGLVFGSFTVTPDINETRQRLTMIESKEVFEKAPPEYAFLIQAFGAFRGLLTNIAFIRHEQYKMQGKYYDAAQLASWISKLQPHFVSVWEFLAWNMAWNISVTTYTPEERWNWVYNGVKLIRDEGLRYNPRAINLYRQLAWIYINKMGENVDEHHMAYKRNWAWRMHLLLGPPPDPLGDYRPDKPFEALQSGVGAEVDLLGIATENERIKREAAKKAKEALAAGERATVEVNIREINATQPADIAKAEAQADPSAVVKKAFYDAMKKIADAPSSLAELLAANPACREMIAQLRDLGVTITNDELTEDAYWSQDGLSQRFFYPVRLLSEPPGMLERVVKRRVDDPKAKLIEPLDKILGIRAGNPDGLALVRFVQKKVLRDVYGMEAARMADLIAVFGPMDWRSVDATGLYWLTQGIIAGNETISSFKNDKTNTTRLIFFCLRNLSLRNRITFEPYTQNVNYAYLNFNPDLNFIEPMQQAYLKYGKDVDPEPTATGVGETFRSGHINFLAEAIRMLWFAGRKTEAHHYYEYLRENYKYTSTGEMNPELLKPIEDYIMDQMREGMDSVREVRLVLAGLMVQAFANLADGNVAQYNALTQSAVELHGYHNQERMKDQTAKDRLEPVADMQADTLRQLLREPSVAAAQTIRKARLWLYLPLKLRQAVYDDCIEALEVECNAMDFDVDRAFPEPDGMEEIRKSQGREGVRKRKLPVETPAQPL